MSAQGMVDGAIMQGGDLTLLPRDVWDEFLAETGLTPQTVPESPHDTFVLYKGHELRRSGAG